MIVEIARRNYKNESDILELSKEQQEAITALYPEWLIEEVKHGDKQISIVVSKEIYD